MGVIVPVSDELCLREVPINYHYTMRMFSMQSQMIASGEERVYKCPRFHVAIHGAGQNIGRDLL